jgi:EmrB/QacA subfamily drug resistance transporter
LPSPVRETNRKLTTAAVLLSLFMAAMEATVVATAMPTVVADLGGVELYGWVGAVYLLGSTVAMPLYGKLADLYGRKPLMLAAIALFLIGSMASGVSQSMWQLIVFRALQALGAGGLQTLAFTVAGDIYTAEERAKIQGIFGAVWALAGMSGPFLGGVMVKYLSWRWVFYVNVPIGLFASALYVLFFRETFERRKVKLDLVGAALLSAAIMALLLGASRVLPAVTIPLALVAGAAFVWQESRAPEPVLPLALIRKKVIAHASLLGAALGASMLATVNYLPLYVQGVLGSTPTAAGATLAPMLIGWPLASAGAGWLLSRVSFRTLIVSGWALATVSSLALGWAVHTGASVDALRGSMFVFGLGMGLSSTPVILAVQQSVTWGERGTATATTTFFRTIGGSISVGSLGAVLAASLSGAVDKDALSALMQPDHGKSLSPETFARISSHLAAGLGTIFVVIASIATLTFGASFFFPNLRLGQNRADVGAEGTTPDRHGSSQSRA